MALYLARYLNVPPASLPGESNDGLNDLPIAAKEIDAALLDSFDRQRQIDAAARPVARHLTLGHSPDASERGEEGTYGSVWLIERIVTFCYYLIQNRPSKAANRLAVSSCQRHFIDSSPLARNGSERC
jgi:hypothetical protein